MIVAFLIVAGPLGLGLILFGLRGRTVGDHPHCRGCGFDVFDVYPDSPKCPECGLWLDGAIRRGQRERRRWAVFAGGVIFAVSAAYSLTQFSSMGYRVMPDAALAWMLADEQAREEAKARLAAGEFSASATRRVIDKALDVQADLAIPWHPSWGELVESAWIGGLTRPADLERYATQAAGFELKVRDAIKQGLTPKVYADLQGEVRVGWNTRINIQLTQDTFSVDGQARPILQNRIARFRIGRGLVRRVHHLPAEEITAELGTKHLSLNITPNYSLSLSQQSPPPLAFNAPRRAVSKDLEVVGHFTGRYTTQGPSDNDRSVNAGLWFDRGNARSKRQKKMVFGTQQPEDLRRFVGWAQLNGRNYPLEIEDDSSSFTAAGHARVLWVKTGDLPESIRDQPSIDIVIRTDWETAETTAVERTVWLGQWRFRDVPLGAEPVKMWNATYDQPPPSLVPAITETLTVEEAMRAPTFSGY